MTSFDDTYLKHIDGDVDWGDAEHSSATEQLGCTETKEYGHGKHRYELPRYVFCWICMEEVDRIEGGAHYRTQRHKHHRASLFREANAHAETMAEVRMCGNCPALLTSDYTCICRIGWFRYAYSRWYRNLFGYYHPQLDKIEKDYPVEVLEKNMSWRVVALRPQACWRQLSSTAERLKKKLEETG